jgi:anionic cell wall polymer biosynthesis LytR-Cps2A-Psr (LCP) family protein
MRISLNETDNATNPLDVKLHGFAHTVATIEQDFHIPINAYAWVGLDGLIKVIDTLGGVDIDVLHPIVDLKNLLTEIDKCSKIGK